MVVKWLRFVYIPCERSIRGALDLTVCFITFFILFWKLLGVEKGGKRWTCASLCGPHVAKITLLPLKCLEKFIRCGFERVSSASCRDKLGKCFACSFSKTRVWLSNLLINSKPLGFNFKTLKEVSRRCDLSVFFFLRLLKCRCISAEIWLQRWIFYVNRPVIYSVILLFSAQIKNSCQIYFKKLSFRFPLEVFLAAWGADASFFSFICSTQLTAVYSDSGVSPRICSVTRVYLSSILFSFFLPFNLLIFRSIRLSHEGSVSPLDE